MNIKIINKIFLLKMNFIEEFSFYDQKGNYFQKAISFYKNGDDFCLRYYYTFERIILFRNGSDEEQASLKRIIKEFNDLLKKVVL